MDPVKRSFDAIVSFVAVVILSPLFVCIAVLIQATSRGPVIYRARRVGKDGALFTLYKFRTMSAASTGGPAITAAGDRRITPVGKILRKTKLDEIPQLFNVLKGDMSLVGPRPEDPHYVNMYTPEQRRILSVPPGITSLASIRYRSEEQLLSGEDWESKYIGTIMPDKLRIDLDYLDRRSFRTDLQILLQTFVTVLRD